MTKIVILGVSHNPNKASYQLFMRLNEQKQNGIALALNPEPIFGHKILDLKEKPSLENIDILTLYLSPKYQKEWEDYILYLLPKKIIFNPGTENEELKRKAERLGIQCENACSLVLLSLGELTV